MRIYKGFAGAGRLGSIVFWCWTLFCGVCIPCSPVMRGVIDFMKKAFLIIVTIIALLFLIRSALIFSEKHTSKKDNEYISSLLSSNIKVGMDFKDIYSFFKKYGNEIKPYKFPFHTLLWSSLSSRASAPTRGEGSQSLPLGLFF